jgi:hypothetical protein
MKRLENLVGMSGVTIRTTIERQLPMDLRRRIFLMPSTNLDDKWIPMVVKVSKMEESFLVEQRLPRGNQEKPFERMSNPAKGKKTTTGSSSGGGADYNIGFKQRFTKPKDLWHLIPADIEEWKKSVRGISDNTSRERRNLKVHLRCGVKHHTQWYCPEN